MTPLAHEASIASSAVTPSRRRRSRRSWARRRPGAAVSPPIDAGQRALHAGDDDDGVGRGDAVEVGEQPVEAGDADVVRADRRRSRGRASVSDALVGDRQVGGAGGDDEHALGARRRRAAPQHASAELDAPGRGRPSTALTCSSSARGEQHRAGAVGEQLADDAHALLGGLARPVDRLGHALAQGAVVVDEGVAEVGERQAAQAARRRRRRRRAPARTSSSSARSVGLVHGAIVPDAVDLIAPIDDRAVDPRAPPTPSQRVGFFGPFGTFTEQALRTQPDLAARRARRLSAPCPTCSTPSTPARSTVGFVPIENSIEGTVNFTQDALAFDHDLLIQREVVLDIEHCLVGPAGHRRSTT